MRIKTGENINCKVCNKLFYLSLNRLKKGWAIYCSQECKKKSGFYRDNFMSSKNPRWHGGRGINNKGYVWVLERSHPNASTIGQVLEHRIIMEKHLGRYLESFENVHHKNGIKTDNRLENLELWVTKQPKGQKPDDLVKWAKEVLKLYGENELKY